MTGLPLQGLSKIAHHGQATRRRNRTLDWVRPRSRQRWAQL